MAALAVAPDFVAFADMPPPTREPFALETGNAKAPVRAELWRLRVPENRQRSSHVIELAFIRLTSTAARPGPPIVWLSGGPGESAINALKGPLGELFLAMREHADVIVLDPRGTGLSRPRLDCPGSFELPLGEPGDRGKVLAAMTSLARECRSFWEARGTHLSAYNVLEMADDVDDIRKALGRETVTLLGASFGTQVALATIRRHGRSVHTAVLLGVVGPDQMLALPSSFQKHLFEIDRLARRDRDLSQRIPDLLGLVGRVLKRLEESPIAVDVSDPDTRENVTVGLGRMDIVLLTRRLLSSREGLEAMPALYDAMAQGRFSGVARVMLSFRRASAPSAVRFLVGCASGASRERRKRIESERPNALLKELLDFPIPEVCMAWGVPELPPDFRAPVRSDLRVLLVSGSLDPLTPAANAEEVRVGFPNVSHVVIEGATHTCLGTSAKTLKVLSRFFRGEAVPSARLSLPPIQFRVPAGPEIDRWARHRSVLPTPLLLARPVPREDGPDF
jgi:pimeloyl-ACP methyl ester carboxylesterase